METVPCAPGLCVGAYYRPRRKRRPVRRRGGLPTAPATVLCALGLWVRAEFQRRRRRRLVCPRGDSRRSRRRCFVRPDFELVLAASAGVSIFTPPRLAAIPMHFFGPPSTRPGHNVPPGLCPPCQNKVFRMHSLSRQGQAHARREAHAQKLVKKRVATESRRLEEMQPWHFSPVLHASGRRRRRRAGGGVGCSGA